MLPWLLCGALALVSISLCVQRALTRKSLDETLCQLNERLVQDTNNPIFISSGDRHIRRLAMELNTQLARLRRQRHRYQDGDRELKEAIANISHDLRTPLTAISGYLELLSQCEQTPKAQQYLHFIENRVQSMTQLTEELFQYSIAASTEEALSFEPVDIKAALEESLAGFYTALTARGIEPAVHMPQNPVVRQLDRSAVSRVLGNLLGNALKYSGGDLVITLRSAGEIVFSNTAPGLDEIQVGRLFHRFFTVESAVGATGLGLSIVKALTERMNGSISARYDRGRLSISLFFPEG